jgi:predicted membrane-bound mannosyltransferase
MSCLTFLAIYLFSALSAMFSLIFFSRFMRSDAISVSSFSFSMRSSSSDFSLF